MNITTAVELETAIKQLKQQRIEKEMEMLYEAKAFVENIKEAAINTSIGVGTGVLAKKLIPATKGSLLKRLAGYGVQAVATNTAFRNADKIKAVGKAIWRNIFK